MEHGPAALNPLEKEGAIRRFESDPGPHLIVVPASLLENWQRELHRWCPDLRFVAY